MPAGEEQLLTRPLALILAAAFGAFLNINLLIPVLPLHTERLGGGDFVAGMPTTALMLSTVAAQVWSPALLGRWGYKPVLISGLTLLGIPVVLYPWTGSVMLLLLVTLLRGVGFGIATVAFAALVAQMAPPERRGEAIGLYGVASTLPSVFGLPFGVWLVFNAGFGVVFLVGVAAPLLGLACLSLTRVEAVVPSERPSGFLSVLRRGPLLRPFLVFTSSTVAAGFMVTFLPLAAPSSGIGSAATALLIWGTVQTAARWWAGRFSDRFGAFRLFAPGILLTGSGAAAMGYADVAPLLLIGATINGFGFGLLQNATISILMERVHGGEYGPVSALWNVGFDAGAGLGPVVFGALFATSGFTTASVATAGLVFAAMSVVLLDGKPEPDL